MIKCYKDKEQGNGVIVELEGDPVEITSDLVCIIAKMLHSGIPLVIIAKAMMLADDYKKIMRWDEDHGTDKRTDEPF